MSSHPLHPAFVHMPIGLWSLASLLDGAVFFKVTSHLPVNISAMLIGFGLVFAMPTILTGMLDMVKLLKMRQSLAGKIMAHASVMGGATCFYFLALLLRYDVNGFHTPGVGALIFSNLGLVTLIFGGWLGGNLVYTHAAHVSTGQTQTQHIS